MFCKPGVTKYSDLFKHKRDQYTCCTRGHNPVTALQVSLPVEQRDWQVSLQL